MSCAECGAPSQGNLCADCERDRYRDTPEELAEESRTDGGQTMSVVVTDGTFYHLDINGTEAVFATQEAAVEYLREHKDEIDLSDPDVRLAAVETGEEWAIEGVPWQNIALQLL